MKRKKISSTIKDKDLQQKSTIPIFESSSNLNMLWTTLDCSHYQKYNTEKNAMNILTGH